MSASAQPTQTLRYVSLDGNITCETPYRALGRPERLHKHYALNIFALFVHINCIVWVLILYQTN